MSISGSSRTGRSLRQGFVFLMVVGLLLLTQGNRAGGQSLAAACTYKDGRCAFLPAMYRPPDPRIRADAQWMYRQMYLAANGVPMGGGHWSFGACPSGDDINPAYREAVRLRVNYYRVMAGVPEIMKFTDEFNQDAQAAALVMSKYNQIVYTIPPDWCQLPHAADGARYSNMIGDHNGPEAVDYYVLFDNYESAINASTLTYPVGHRRYILYPQTQVMGDGDVPATTGHMAVNALRVIDADHYYDSRPVTRNSFVAWPPAAYVPYQVVPALWSFAYPAADFSRATVSVSHNGARVAITQFKPLNGWGENTLVWKIGNWDPWPKPAGDQSYVVTVKNVYINGQASTFTYTVVIFDPG